MNEAVGMLAWFAFLAVYGLVTRNKRMHEMLHTHARPIIVAVAVCGVLLLPAAFMGIPRTPFYSPFLCPEATTEGCPPFQWETKLALAVGVILCMVIAYLLPPPEQPSALRSVLQYNVLLAISTAVLTMKTVLDIVHHEFVQLDYTWLPPAQVRGKLEQALERAGVHEAHREEIHTELELNAVFRALVAVGTLAAAVCVAIVAYHVVSLLVAFARSRPDEVHRYFVQREAELMLQVVMLPGIFAFLSLRAMIRMLSVFTGSCYSDNFVHFFHDAATWKLATRLQEVTYDADFALANAAECWTIGAFGFLCLSVLRREVSARHYDTLRLTTMQGVGVFVLLGAAKALNNLGLVLLCEFAPHSIEGIAHGGASQATVTGVHLMWKHLLSAGPSLKMLMNLASVQCIVHMMVICGFNLGPITVFKGMEELRSHIPNSHTALTGVRILILVSQMQSNLLHGVLSGHFHHFSDWQINLLHAQLLCIECMAVALWHLHIFERISEVVPQLDSRSTTTFPSQVAPSGRSLAEPFLQVQ